MAKNYGSIDEEKQKMINNQIALDVLDKDFFPNNPFGESFDESFWKSVFDLYQDGEGEKNWAEALSEVRVSFLTEKFKKSGQDVIFGLMTVYDNFYNEAVRQDQLELLPSFIQQLSELVNLILNKDYDQSKKSGRKSTYSKFVKCTDSKKTVLHLAAERNLKQIASHLISLYPGQCYIKSSGTIGKKIALELALTEYHDSTAALLIHNMLNERVRQLFQFDEAIGRCKFSFAAIAGNEKMKDTVLAVLDCLINPDFPYVPVPPGEETEAAWSKIPDMPMRYHIYYLLLDGDDNGRPAKIKDVKTGKFVKNKDFNQSTKSALQQIAESPYNDDIIVHPAIRLLVQRKWKEYGHFRIKMQCVFYLIYLLLMSLAFFLSINDNNRANYSTTKNKIRGVCEALTLIISVIYFISEIDQMFKERLMYWKDFYNYMDLLGLSLVIALLPIKWLTVDMITGTPSAVEWICASIAYLVNFLRVIKYFPAYRQIGVYAKTFAKILYTDISKFFLLYSVVMAAFTGSVILALKASKDGFSKAGLTGWLVLLQEIRALTEGQGFHDSYAGVFSVGLIILLMVNMFVVIVMLTNILIGQLSYRYENALDNAKIQYDIDKTKTLTRMENSRFKCWNSRVKYYVDAAYITETAVVQELLNDWESIAPAKFNDDGKESVRSLMKKFCSKKF